MSLYEHIDRIIPHYYRVADLRRTYESFYNVASDLLNEVSNKDSVSITNNGFWEPPTDDENEFTFRPGGSILESEMVKPLDRESIEEFLRGVAAEVRPEDRRVTISTGEAGQRALQEALQTYLTEERSAPDLMDSSLIDEMISYNPALDSQTIIMRPRRMGMSISTHEAIRRQNELVWSTIRDTEELPDSVSVVREFETEQEAIAYLDSLSQETIEHEENTDTIQDGESNGLGL